MQQEETPKVRRIRQISVTNLFGIFNHTLPLNTDEHITIIHGPNGFGKTIMLKLLHELFSYNNQLLRTIPFDEFLVDFKDNTNFWVSKSLPKVTEKEEADKQVITFYSTGNESYILPQSSLPEASTILAQYESEIKSRNFTISLKNDNNIKNDNDISFHIKDMINWLSGGFSSERLQMPPWLLEMRRSVPIRFIETQRLLNSTRPSKSYTSERTLLPEYAVTEDSRHLVEIISKKLAESARLSQSLDRTFPARVINPTTQQLQVKDDDLISKLKKLEEKRSRLMATGLLDQEAGATFPGDYDQGIEPSKKAVLAVYAEDTKQKLGIFDELAQKINLLTSIINSRFLYKTMTVDKEQGLVFTSDNGIKLPLENLSSGEQHELVLFYELLFRVTPGSLILIDEPELSLHIVWQEQFLKDVQQVAKLTNIDIILATHSPDIINDRRDLVIELKEPTHGR